MKLDFNYTILYCDYWYVLENTGRVFEMLMIEDNYPASTTAITTTAKEKHKQHYNIGDEELRPINNRRLNQDLSKALLLSTSAIWQPLSLLKYFLHTQPKQQSNRPQLYNMDFYPRRDRCDVSESKVHKIHW
jgi:hypothetical protein